ncbi:hypothetical protein QFZ46_003159 [Microbacterium murale]|uniref:Bacteriocin biosynthesis cyclodehydratase domain-containing protein n=1 Tax=Microbacterium murale TaxID=1081040 RepID=A0ABU0PCE2_9MICO|nr:hypothetical protein [Microbacterium murale]
MSPITPPTLTRLDPAYPLLWRDVDTVQFGLEGAVRISVSEPWVEQLLQSLRLGFRPSAFDVIAHGAGAPRDAARELLSALQPVLRTDAPPLPHVWIESLNLTDSRIAARTEIALVDEGFSMTERATPHAVAVVLVEGAASARQFAAHLRDDVTHLPIAFEMGGTTIGPLVVPGRTPCLTCRDGHERDRDPAWPMLHAQLIGTASGRITAARTAEAAALAARILSEPGRTNALKSVRISPDGRRVWRSVKFHAECRCREQSFRSPEGTGTAAAHPDQRHETTTAPGFARRA